MLGRPRQRANYVTFSGCAWFTCCERHVRRDGRTRQGVAIRHPAVTSAIIGPRTTEHLDGYLTADGIELSADVLDRIDEIVPPGVTIKFADNMWNVGTTPLDAEFRSR
jgi:hypothetical protein